MSAQQMHKALFVFTECDAVPHSRHKPTGFYLSEAAHPFFVLINAGFTVDFATPNGRPAPVDPMSVKMCKDQESLDFLNRFVADGRVLQCQKLGMMPLDTYEVVFFPGGHGPMFDLAKDKHSAQLVADWFQKGGRKVLSAVCHGSAAFVPMMTAAGAPLVTNHSICCFSDNEERSMKVVDIDKELPFLLESRMRELGAKTVAAKDMAECVVSSGYGPSSYIVTGQNPASARPLAQAIVKALHAQ